MVFSSKQKTLKALLVAFGATLAILFSLQLGWSAPIAPNGKVDVAKLMAPNKLPDHVQGDENAPVTIIEYASLTCTHCADFTQNTLPAILDKYVKTGKAKFILREFAYDPRATAGFMVARCAPADRYYPLVDVLMQKQMEWAAPKDALTPLKQIAKLAGFSDESFNACLNNQEILEGVNASFTRANTEFGVTLTPTFFINGDKYEGALTLSQMSEIIDSYLAKK